MACRSGATASAKRFASIAPSARALSDSAVTTGFGPLPGVGVGLGVGVARGCVRRVVGARASLLVVARRAFACGGAMKTPALLVRSPSPCAPARGAKPASAKARAVKRPTAQRLVVNILRLQASALR